MEEQESWVYCAQCGKRLLKRKPNGVFHLKFGKNNQNEAVIDLKIFGTIQIKCFREQCQYVNTFTLFPTPSGENS